MKTVSKEVVCVPNSARTFSVVPGGRDLVPTVVENKIISLNLGTHTICLGETLTVQSKPYKVNSISKSIVGKRLVYNLSVSDLTKSSLFVLPMLGGNRKLFMYNSLFVNCFIGTKKHSNTITLLYRFSGDPLFLKFEQALKKFRGFIDCYDPSPYFVLFIFKVPEQHTENYVHFLNGRYSELSPEYKEKILDFHGFDIDGELAQIMYKAPKRKLRLESALDVTLSSDSELYSIMTEEDEIFNPKLYI